MAQKSVSLIHKGDLPLQDTDGAGCIWRSFISTLRSRRFKSYVSAQTRDRKLLSKWQVARLFSVSMHTIDYWLQDGKLPEPKRTFPRQKWDYEELIVRTRLSQKIGSYNQKIRFIASRKSQEIELKKMNTRR